MAGKRIPDADNRSGEGGFYLRPFKAQVGIDHFTGDEPQIFAVAQRLGANDLAVLEGDVLAVPSQIFALHNAVADCDIFCVPECVFCVENTVFKDGIRDILERILPFQPHVLCSSEHFTDNLVGI